MCLYQSPSHVHAAFVSLSLLLELIFGAKQETETWWDKNKKKWGGAIWRKCGKTQSWEKNWGYKKEKAEEKIICEYKYDELQKKV